MRLSEEGLKNLEEHFSLAAARRALSRILASGVKPARPSA